MEKLNKPHDITTSMFEMNIRIVNPMLYEKNLDFVLLNFLNSIGYMPRVDPQRDFERAIKSVPYRLFNPSFRISQDFFVIRAYSVIWGHP